MKKTSILLGLALITTLTSDPVPLPEMLDFAQFPTTPTSPHYPPIDPAEVWKWGAHAFNCASELMPLFAYLQREYQIQGVVETGTLLGSTTLIFSILFNEVHTVEIDLPTFVNAKKRLKPFSNVQCHLGNSPEILKNKILPSFQEKRALFYLDAHGQANYWPLLDELEAISQTHKDNCIIVIDDFQVPGRPEIPYDYYGSNTCSFDYIKEKLNLVFSSYTFHYIIPKSALSKAKFVAIPKQWKTNNL